VWDAVQLQQIGALCVVRERYGCRVVLFLQQGLRACATTCGIVAAGMLLSILMHSFSHLDGWYGRDPCNQAALGLEGADRITTTTLPDSSSSKCGCSV
jgi:hypothetical protein